MKTATNLDKHIERKFLSLPLEKNGLPDNADFEMHEDYIMWHHWTEVAQEVTKEIKSLQVISEYGVYK